MIYISFIYILYIIIVGSVNLSKGDPFFSYGSPMASMMSFTWAGVKQREASVRPICCNDSTNRGCIWIHCISFRRAADGLMCGQ